MKTLYVYSLLNGEHLTTITGADEAACTRQAAQMYGLDNENVGWTFDASQWGHNEPKGVRLFFRLFLSLALLMFCAWLFVSLRGCGEGQNFTEVAQ